MKVLITGGSGSFGRVLAATLVEKYDPEEVRIFSRNAERQEKMRADLPDLTYILGDVRDLEATIVAANGCDTIIHTAALKFINLCEKNPWEAILTNVHGAWNVISAARKLDIERVMNVSTDKVVNAISFYGTTKVLAESLFTKYGFVSCRFGNFIGSDGSVIPLFRKQAAEGTELTLTDKNMVRYWISLPRAVEYLIERLLESKGGEVFVPKMSTLRLDELADIIAPGVKQVERGAGFGEKIQEDIIGEEELLYTTERENDYIIHKPTQAKFEAA